MIAPEKFPCPRCLNLRNDPARQHQRQVVVGHDARRGGDDGRDRVQRPGGGHDVAQHHEFLERGDLEIGRGKESDFIVTVGRPATSITQPS